MALRIRWTTSGCPVPSVLASKCVGADAADRKFSTTNLTTTSLRPYRLHSTAKRHSLRPIRELFSSGMPKPRRHILAAEEETLTPPPELLPTQQICRVVSAAGKNLYQVTNTANEELLVELAQRFRSTIWIKRGNYVLIDDATLAERDNKIAGEIINIVRDERAWMKMSYWPSQFQAARRGYAHDSDDSEEESTVGRMPPSDSEDD